MITTRSIDLGNGSRRYFIQVAANYEFMRTSDKEFTHAVIGIGAEPGSYQSPSYHTSLKLAQKKLAKVGNAVIVELN